MPQCKLEKHDSLKNLSVCTLEKLKNTLAMAVFLLLPLEITSIAHNMISYCCFCMLLFNSFWYRFLKEKDPVKIEEKPEYFPTRTTSSGFIERQPGRSYTEPKNSTILSFNIDRPLHLFSCRFKKGFALPADPLISMFPGLTWCHALFCAYEMLFCNAVSTCP